MIIKSLEIFSQNVQKNKLLTDSILENNKNYDIILIQEPPWSNIWQIPSISSQEGNNPIRAPLSQTSFGHISINSSSILTVLMATESP